MEQRSVQAVVKALNEQQVRYLIVGGLAVVAHGYVRLTVDMDLVIDPDSESIKRAVSALAGLGYRPRAPVAFEALADPNQRKSWARDKGMTVFSAFSAEHATTEVDLFLEPPFDFETVYSRAVRIDVGQGQSATFVSLADLLKMKRAVGRPADILDVEVLEKLRKPGAP